MVESSRPETGWGPLGDLVALYDTLEVGSVPEYGVTLLAHLDTNGRPALSMRIYGGMEGGEDGGVLVSSVVQLLFTAIAVIHRDLPTIAIEWSEE